MQTRTPNKKKQKTWELGTIRSGVSAQGVKYSYVVFAKDTVITVAGKEVDLGEFNSCFIDGTEKMLESIDFKVSQGWITEEQADKAVAAIEEKNIKGAIKVNLKD